MKILKYFILTLILFKLDSFALVYLGPTIGSLLSFTILGCVGLYYFLSEKEKPPMMLIVLGICYFFISVVQFSGIASEFITDVIKYFVYIIAIGSLIKNVSAKELTIYLLIGATSIIINAVFFPNLYGRYSGFYMNPNNAGLVALLGIVFAYSFQNIKIRALIQFVCILGGIMTLSRYFILLMILITLLSIIYNKKNLLVALGGALAFAFVLMSGDFKLNADRFKALQSIFSDDVDTKTITKESREETWALYKQPILNHLVIGNGYKAFQGHENDTVGISVGVHNTYLMILGESGFFPFFLVVFIYMKMIFRSAKGFFKNPQNLYISLVLSTFLLVSHNYFDNYILLFFTIWLMKSNEELITPKAE